MWAFPGHDGAVVVGCDSSGESQNAVVEATREVSRRGTELVLLSVVEHRPYWPDSLAWVARAEAGLLVLGGRGDGGQLTFALGSTSAELARSSTRCPAM